MPKTEIAKLEDLAGRVGEELAVSDWLEVTQERIMQFAEATGDHQWIHTDPARAAKESPYGGTIAHGYLTLSLLAKFAQESVKAGDVRMGVNYGLNRVRFTSPVRAGKSVRARFKLAAFEAIPGGAQVTWAATVEIDGSDKPACVAEMVSRWYL
ncbi:MAG TPA: MaoC family dehydratase [Rhodocyclaceae bacterium]|nr:MaoC family dehydratase [Rhodocyclaceae bacterium]HUY03112.1 MaoC family dehydratase [Rhodocyclaceae bacterium]